MEKTINLKKPISPAWKKFLKDYTSQQDVAKVSLDHDLGYHTLHGIKNRTLNVSNEKNKVAIDALAKVAINNARATIKNAELDVKKMEIYLSEILDNE